MAPVALILPDIALILAGFVLARLTRWGGEFWAGVEKLTYFVLFPALLFYSNARARIDFGTAGPLLVTVLGAIAAGIVFGLAGKLFRAPAPTFAAGFQCAFRFNSYIGLALAARLGGDSGIAMMAAIVGVTVPIVNAVSVIALARGRGARVMREIATNPLIVSCVAGIAYGALGLPLPEVVQTVLSRFGAAALVLGLLAVGAAFNPALPQGHRGLIAYLLAVKLLALPAVAWALGRALAVSPESLILAVAFAALPTASAAYILAIRLGGDSRIAATLVSYSVAGSLLTLPLWLAALR
jgi:malonate transporter